MKCLTFTPFPLCGTNGDCIELTNETSVCECKNGYSQSLDFSSYFISENELEGMVCFYHDATVTTLYVLLLLMSLSYLLLHAVVIKTRSQLMRQLPLLVFGVLVLVLSIYRLARGKDAAFGVDFFYTFMIISAGSACVLQAYFFLTQYLQYVSKKVKIGENKTLYIRAENARLIFKFIVIFSSVATHTIWISLWGSRDTMLLWFSNYKIDIPNLIHPSMCSCLDQRYEINSSCNRRARRLYYR